jgi:hypothetical protein
MSWSRTLNCRVLRKTLKTLNTLHASKNRHQSTWVA